MMTDFSSAPPPSNPFEPHHEAMWDKLSAAQQRKLVLSLVAFVINWQSPQHACTMFPVLNTVWQDPPRSGGFPIDLQTSDVLPSRPRDASVTLGSPSPWEQELQWKGQR